MDGRAESSARSPEHLRTATTMYREMGMRFWLEQADAEVRSWLLRATRETS
jgi:hypothetical protein